MDINLIFAIIFVVILIIFLYKNRKRITVGGIFPLLYVFMLRSKFGIKTMDKIASKLRGFLKVLGIIGVVIGFLGMAFVCFEIVYNTYLLFFKPAAVSGVQLVLPIEAKGVFYVPFIYWLLAIFVVAFVHEFSHGLFGRAYKIPIVSTGMAILGAIVPIVPAAFVEPDEKKFKKFKKKAKLSMLAAGPFANIVIGFLIILLLLPVSPFLSSFYEFSGVEITRLAEEGPAAAVGMSAGEVIKKIDGENVQTVKDFQNILEKHKKGDVIKIRTDKGTHDVALEEKGEKAFMGIFIKQQSILKEGKNAILAGALSWIYGLLLWVYLLNIGIGLFNLLPIGPLDGGRMLKEVLSKVKKGPVMFKMISTLFFVLIMVNIFSGFLK